MRKAICVMVSLWVNVVFAASNSCDIVDKIVSRGEAVYKKTGLSYFSASRLIFYKENITTGKDAKFSMTPVLFSEDGKRYLMDLQWDHENVSMNSMPSIDTVSLMDFNKNGLNELILITKREGYLGEYGTVGYVMHALVVPDEHTLFQEHGCVIRAYPYINEHLAAIRTATIDGKDTCEEGFCNTKQVLKELSRIQNLSALEFLGEAHALALSSFNNKMIEMAARISDAALVYPSMLSESTVNIFNDMGFFKEQAKQYEDAVAILGPVSVKFPNRAVVFLNLGDAYSGLNKSVEASASYARYVALMRAQGKEKKIPKRITSFFSGK